MEGAQELYWLPQQTSGNSPRKYRRDHIARSECWSVEKLDRSQRMSNERLNRLQDVSVTRQDRSHRSGERVDKSDQRHNKPQKRPRKNMKQSTESISKSDLHNKNFGISVDKSIDRSLSRSLVKLEWSADRSFSNLDISGDVNGTLGESSPDASPRQYRRAELTRSLDDLLENTHGKSTRVTHNQSLDMLLDMEDRRVEIGGSPAKSREALNVSKNNLLGSAEKPRHQSERLDETGSSNLWISETPKSRVQRKQKRARVERENGKCVEVAVLWVHVCTAAIALGGVVTLAIMATKWDYQRKVCPLFVTVPPGFHIHWGNEDMTACYITAFLPLIIVVLSLVLAALHCSVLRTWNGNYMPTLAASRIIGLVTLAVSTLEAALALASAIILTEGFRQTCISFDLSLSWGEAPHTCRSNYIDRDFAYRLGYLHTFDLILGGLVCGWTLVVLTIILVFLSVTRARLCACQCL